MTLARQVRDAWLSLGEPPPGLVVAISGGADSVALTRALVAVRPDASILLVLAHLNHRLRGDDSDADEAFVTTLHLELAATCDNLHLRTHSLDIAALAAEQGENLEAVARRERYRWLTEVARTYRLKHVATGHTASDQAETVLFRLLRGSGVEGLRGIAARRPLAEDVEVVRPLLGVTRGEVLAYLTSIGQTARHDASNDDRRYTRNRIRHELLPLLVRDYNPRLVSVLGRLAEQASEIADEEESAARTLLAQIELPRAGRMIILDVTTACQSTPRLLRAALRRVWHREGWAMGEMGFVEWQRLADLARAEKGSQDFPGRIRARHQGRVLQIGPSEVF